ncbi:MAG: glycosyltransferase WbuB, partial [Alcaligenaceae bacterium]
MSSIKRIWIVSEYTRGNQNSTGYFWEKLIDHFQAKGLEVKVITVANSDKKPKGSSIIERVVSKTVTAVRLARAVLKNVQKGDVVFSGTNPESLLFLLALLKKIKVFRWNVLVHDVFPENLISAKITDENRLGYRIIKSVFDWVYSQPSKLFVIGRDMKLLVDEKTGKPEKSHFIPNWVDSEAIVPKKKNESEIIKNLGWQEKTVFQFFGNIGRVQG